MQADWNTCENCIASWKLDLEELLLEKGSQVGCLSKPCPINLSTWSSFLALVGLVTWLESERVFCAEPFPEPLEHQFTSDVLPFVKTFCFDCHGTTKQEGKLNLSADTTITALTKNSRTWELVLERLVAGEMPPTEFPRQPSSEARKSAVAGIKAIRDFEARRNAGDPGIVLARRLSNTEFDNTIRDLTGADMRPTREFPVDPANEAGFDNSGESLSMSPALVKKYLAAARLIADHVVFTPKGFVFASHPVVTETDRDKYCVQQIVEFYQRHEVDFADYFVAAWHYQHRVLLGRSSDLLRDFAQTSTTSKSPLSPKYLARVWSVLTESEVTGPLAELQSEWQKLVSDTSLTSSLAAAVNAKPDALASKNALQAQITLRRECERIRDMVVKTRKSFDTTIEKLHVKGNSDGSQPLILWWNRQIAAQRMRYSGDGKDQTLDAAKDRFSHVFPNAFAVTSRGHYADAKLGADVRLLTAGFHLMQGYFRDDEPLCELVLDDSQKAEIDSLWQNLNFVTLVPYRQYKDFLFFERAEPPRFAGGPEFDFARPEDKDVTSEAKFNRMRDAYLARAKQNEASTQAIEAIETYFANMTADVRWIEQTQIMAIPSHLESLTKFAERAFRRPLAIAERDELLAYYHQLRERDGLTHEDAVRDSIASILMSPHFCFRFDLAIPGESVRSLNSHELASRLSYFLWSSLPDQELLTHAEKGDFQQADVLIEQIRRMLCDKRVRGLATQFAGNWLEFRRFEELNSVDRERFPAFTNELREAMYEEPLRFFIDVVSHNRSILDFLDADDMIVNPVLAKHYGIEIDASLTSGRITRTDDGWFRVENAHRYGRGGVPTMSVFLTKNSPGLRTSPVKRGYWVVRRLLGEHIPAPPPEVPELPKDEAGLGELTLRQVLARHRDHKACAGCHQRFDSVGLVFEGYNPIGERRTRDLAGHPVETSAIFPDGSEGAGIEGLRRYLLDRRRDEFIDNFCSKLFSYALGRSLILSDRPTIEQMREKLDSNGFRIEFLIESIVTSPQFLKKRGMEEPQDE